MNHLESSTVSAFSASTGALFSAINARCINFRDKVPLLSVPGVLEGGGIWGEFKLGASNLHPSLSTMSQGPSKSTPSTSPLLTYTAPDPAEPSQPPIVKTQSKERLHVGGLHPTVDECVLYI